MSRQGGGGGPRPEKFFRGGGNSAYGRGGGYGGGRLNNNYDGRDERGRNRHRNDHGPPINQRHGRIVNGDNQSASSGPDRNEENENFDRGIFNTDPDKAQAIDVDVSKHWEEICKAGSSEERLKIFNSLEDDRMKTQVLMPAGVAKANLPSFDSVSKDHWDSKIENAVKKAVKEAKVLAKELGKRQERDPQAESDSSGYDSDTAMFANTAGSSNSESIEPFAKHLAHCTPALAGFLITKLLSKGEKKWCFCPACKDNAKGSMRSRPLLWKFWYLCGLDEVTHDLAGKRYGPGPFVQHIEEKMEADTEEGRLHRVLYVFLEDLFKDFHRPGIPHIAFLEGKTGKHDLFQEAEKIVSEQTQSEILLVQRENAKIAKELEALAKKNAELESLEKVNRELADKLKMKDEFLDNFETKMEQHGISMDESIEFLQTIIPLMQTKIGRTLDKEKYVEIKVDRVFNINNSFGQWYEYPEKDTGGFFTDFPKSESATSADASPVDEKKADVEKSTVEEAKIVGNSTVLSEPDMPMPITEIHILKKWNIIYGTFELNAPVALTKNKRRNERLKAEARERIEDYEDDHMAIDDGGPSRQFFNDFFTGLQDLCVGNIQVTGDATDEPRKRKALLFEAGVNCIYPKTDEIVYSQDRVHLHQKSDRYYRAVGRILVHALLSHTEKGPKKGDDKFERFFIEEHVLPGLYRNFLLRGVSPLDENNYPIGKLVDDVIHVLDRLSYAKLSRKNRREKIMEYLFFTDDEKTSDPEMIDKFFAMDKIQKERLFREMANKALIVSRRRVLENLKEGLELGGKVPFSKLLKPIPSEGISKFFFATRDITEADFFTEDQNGHENLSFITVDEGVERKDEANGVYQVNFMENFKKWIKSTKRENLVKFLLFTTAQAYIPDLKVHKEFKVIIEFSTEPIEHDRELTREEKEKEERDQREALPFAHTCDYTIKFPESAYEGNYHKMAEKLELAIAVGDFGAN